MKLIFASSNKYKLKEISAIAPKEVEIVSMADIGFKDELPETRDTLEGNSLQKAEFLWLKYHLPCFSEDTGLEIDALKGGPGVYSARYAGKEANFEANIDKVLTKMKGIKDRKARFKTVITYYDEAGFVQFEGITEGIIAQNRRGSEGFGYDPIFEPEGKGKTYAEMTLEEKNAFSHRQKSFVQLANHLCKISV